MIHTIDLPEYVNFDIITDHVNEKELNPHGNTYVRDLDMHTKLFWEFLEPEISNVYGKRLYPMESKDVTRLCQVIPGASNMFLHLDRRPVKIVAQVPIHQTHPWDFSFYMGKTLGWHTVETRKNQVLIYDGTKIPHSAPRVYNGDKSLLLISSFSTDPADGYSTNYTESGALPILKDMNLTPMDFQGHRRQKRWPNLIHITNFNDDTYEQFKDMILGAEQSPIREVMNKSCHYQELIRRCVAWRNTDFIIHSQTMGLVFDRKVEYNIHPMEDICIALPLDEQSANASIRINQYTFEAGSVPFKSGIVFPGYPTQIELKSDKKQQCVWAMVPYRYYRK